MRPCNYAFYYSALISNEDLAENETLQKDSLIAFNFCISDLSDFFIMSLFINFVKLH